MLTVNIKRRDNAREYVQECDAVEFEPDRSEPNAGLLIIRNDGTSDRIALSDTDADLRDAYVVNNAGQPVARYIL